MKILIQFAGISAVVAIFSAAGAESARLLPFQGRLTDQSGIAVSNGVRLVQFKIFEVPSGGSPTWAGELHRTTVNGGLVNVLLGSKTPFTGVDFDRQLYLEITVDINGDNAITAADPPMLPRQAILPVIFAKEAADSRLLKGYDWSAILVGGATNPSTGHILGAKIETGGITSLQLGDNVITAPKLAANSVASSNILDGTIAAGDIGSNAVGAVAIVDGAVTAPKLGDGAVTAPKLGTNSVATVTLQDASVTQRKLAPRPVGTNVAVGVGGVAVSLSTGTFFISSTTDIDVLNLTVTISTSGRPVFVGLFPSGSANGYVQAYDVNSAAAEMILSGVRAAQTIGQTTLRVGFGNTVTASVHFPPSSVSFMDFPPAGEHTYKLRARVAVGDAGNFVNCCLIAYEF